MKPRKLVKAVACCLLLSMQFGKDVAVQAQGHRIPRPSAQSAPVIEAGTAATIQPGLGQTGAEAPAAVSPAGISSSPVSSIPITSTPISSAPISSIPISPTTNSPSPDSNIASVPGKVLQANASVDLEEQQNARYPETISNWENRKLRDSLKAQSGTADESNNGSHKGLKSHVGGAVSKLGLVVGTVANAYIPVASVHLTNADPKIEIVPGHCPAAFDPAFQIPVRWWDILSTEEGDRTFGPQWKLWLSAVQAVFQSHARELRETPGVASLHIMVNPDGSILRISIYSGAERGNAGHTMNARTMEHLYQIIQSVGQLPAFPAGSKVRCYHLIFNGSAGI